MNLHVKEWAGTRAGRILLIVLCLLLQLLGSAGARATQTALVTSVAGPGLHPI